MSKNLEVKTEGYEEFLAAMRYRLSTYVQSEGEQINMPSPTAQSRMAQHLAANLWLYMEQDKRMAIKEVRAGHHRPVCSPCRVEMRPALNDVSLVDYQGDPEYPAKVWSADEWACPACGHQIVIGFGNHPLMHHAEEGFLDALERINPLYHRENHARKGA